MNKHTFGFLLFSFIVGTSAIIYGFFFAPSPLVHPVYVFENQPEPRKSCRKERFKQIEGGDVRAKVLQAVLNQNTNQLDMNFSLDSKNNLMNEISVRLDFFVKDGKKTRFLASENVTLDHDFNVDYESTSTVNLSIDWLKDLKSVENLYVVPQTQRNFEKYNETTPRFDKANATPVTVANED